ncbi:hypothetical protein CVH10_17020, partial [Halomonas sp. ND22Bw]
MTAGILSPTNAVRSKPQRDGTAPPTVEHDLIRAHGLAAVITLLISAVFGTLVAVKFTFPDFLGGS